MTSTTSVLFAIIWLIPSRYCQDSGFVFIQPEEQPIGYSVGGVSGYTSILNMVGEDDRTKLRYSILSDSLNSNLFSVDAVSGNISVAKRVDRESICPLSASCEVSFRVAVSGIRNFFTTIPVKINITDINDNTPTFPPPGVMEIHISEAASEDITQILTPASDADSSQEFGVHSYALEPPSDTFAVMFSRNFVGTPQVSLILKQKLDRESQDKYALLVVARDGGIPPKSGSLTVNIIVDDVNDNDPKFTEKVYFANFSEEAGPDFLITIVTANDDDINNNGQVVYEMSTVLIGSNSDVVEKINVDRKTGALTLKQQMVSGEYKFLINAQDLGNPPRSDQAIVSITVIDTINNPPIVTLNSVKIDNQPPDWVSEGSGVSTVVAVLSVDDSDSGKNGSVTCESLDSHFQLQLLEPRRYKIMIAIPLDRETQVSYNVSVICKDQGTPSLSSASSLTLYVMDINDNSPVFEKSSYVQFIAENNMKDAIILGVNASDKDAGQNAVVEYRLVNSEGDFKITPDSGVIKANRRFDREEKDRYSFVVLAVDHGNPPLTGTATVTVNILDVNDVAPRFTQDQFRFELYENKDPGSIVGDVIVTDPDSKDGGIFTLTLKPVDEKDIIPFAISPEGQITSLDKFDREERDIYNFYITATDQGSPKLSSSAQVTVRILDINDVRPTFVFPSDQNFTAFVNAPIRQDANILQIQVYDNDENQNGFLTYTIAATNSSGLFRIGLFDGKIIANTNLGTSDIGTYFITINATDQGVPSLWDVRNLYLVVQSKDASTDDFINEYNVLIVACLICFTVMICGAVLAIICLVRRHDQRRNITTKQTLFPGRLHDIDNDDAGEDSINNDKVSKLCQHHSPIHDHISYHQQKPHHPDHNNYNSTTDSNNTGKPLVHFTNSGVRGLTPEKTSGKCSSSGLYVTKTKLHKLEDIHSTNSMETGAVDSGHGSDEDMSSSMDQHNTPPVFTDNGRLVDMPVSLNQQRTDSGSSARAIAHRPQRHQPSGLSLHHQNLAQRSLGSANPRQTQSQQPLSLSTPQRHLMQQPLGPISPPSVPNSTNSNPLGLTNPRTVPNSTRSTPKVAPVHQNRHTIKLQQPLSRKINTNLSLPHHPTADGTAKKEFGPQTQSPNKESPKISTLPTEPLSPNMSTFGSCPPVPPKRTVSFMSQSSLCDDSDLNTTTSGSYSVTSEDVDKLYGLIEVRDMYV